MVVNCEQTSKKLNWCISAGFKILKTYESIVIIIPYAGFRKWCYTPVIIHGIFGVSMNHPASLGYPHDYGKPQVKPQKADHSLVIISQEPWVVL